MAWCASSSQTRRLRPRCHHQSWCHDAGVCCEIYYYGFFFSRCSDCLSDTPVGSDRVRSDRGWCYCCYFYSYYYSYGCSSATIAFSAEKDCGLGSYWSHCTRPDDPVDHSRSTPTPTRDSPPRDAQNHHPSGSPPQNRRPEPQSDPPR